MKKFLVVFISVLIGFGSAQLALAKKPDDAGGKAAMKEHKSAMKEMQKGAHGDDSYDSEKKRKDHSRKEKAKKEKIRDRDDDGASGLAKQREKKAEQERKDLGKGSEQGQASREEHSRKWWKLWE